MNMKTLQNDFTTPEQSQRLSKLGVPTDSANGILLHYAWAEENLDEENWEAPRYIENNLPASQALDMYLTDQDEYDIAIPCWSALRLMEIIDICALEESFDPNTDEYPTTIKVMNKLHIQYVEYLVKSIERAVQLENIDFSKLEE